MGLSTYPTFNFPPPPTKGSNYVYDPAYVDPNNSANTGVYRPLQTSDIAASPGSATITAPNTSGVGFTNTTLVSGVGLAANSSRISWTFQNASTVSPYFILLGATQVDTGHYHLIANPSTAYAQGGASITDSTWKGAISIFGSGRYSLFEMS